MQPGSSHDENQGRNLTVTRLLFVGVAALVLLACVLSASNSRPVLKHAAVLARHSKGTTMTNSEQYAQIKARNNAVSSSTACGDWFARQSSQADLSQSTFKLMQELPASPKGTINTVTDDGIVVTRPYNEENLDSVSNWRRLLSQKHKWIQMSPSERWLVYPDNTVVKMDTHACELMGLFEHTASGDVHPLVSPEIVEQRSVMADSPSPAPCRKDLVGICHKDGQSCRAGAYKPRGAWTLQVLCAPGFRSQLTYSQTVNANVPYGYYCGCGTACTPSLKCDDAAKLGKCSINKNPCALQSSLKADITKSVDVLKIITTASKAAGSVVALAGAIAKLSPVYGAGAGLIANFFGFSGLTPQSKPSPTDVFNSVTSMLNKFAADVEQCFKIAQVVAQEDQIKIKLNTIQGRLDPTALSKKTVANRIDFVWKNNMLLCEELGSAFDLLSSSEANRILPLAPKVMELCVGNYLGFVADLTAQNKVVPYSIKEPMQVLSRRMYDGVVKVRNAYNARFNTQAECGFFTADKTLLQSKINFLNTDVVNPVKAFAQNFISI